MTTIAARIRPASGRIPLIAATAVLLSACSTVRDVYEELAEPSRARYSETVPAMGGVKSVGAELVEQDRRKDTLLDIDLSEDIFPGVYRRKEKVNQRFGIAYNTDYSILMQRSSFSTTPEDDAASSVFRIYANWLATGDSAGTSGNLVTKFEHRGTIFGRQTPRDLGFATGSALSTANYKDNGWGFTDFYWKQSFQGGKSILLLGHMDPGDWADQHVLLNAWTNLLSDAFYNNPTQAIPSRTFSAVGRLGFSDRWYAAAGVHDANGLDNELNISQVFNISELFTWAEIGFRSRNYTSFGETTHINVWHQDERVEAGVEESWGVTFSSSKVYRNGITAVLRAGWAEGDAPQMREFVGGIVSFMPRGSDRLLFGVGWGSPPDKSLRSQTTFEVLYRLQLTQNFAVSPDLQVTFNPSFVETEDRILVWGLRLRYVF